MYLRNNTYEVTVSIDEMYSVDSADNRYYDFTFNPLKMRRSSLSKTFAIEVTTHEQTKYIALVGSFYCYDDDCALLDGDLLTVLQNNTISQINLAENSLVLQVKFDCLGCCFAIYRLPKGYIIYGEIEVIKLNDNFEIEWTFSGADIFVTQNELLPFEMTEKQIKLYDWQGTYYELDFDGNVITAL